MRRPATRPSLLRAVVDCAARLALTCLLLGASCSAQAQVGVAEITQLRIVRADEGLLLTANVRFELPAVVDEALQKGIPMFFVAEATVLRGRWYWYDRQTSHEARHMRLSYHPLARRWRLVVSHMPIGNSGVALGQSFDTRDEALAAIQRISNWKIANPGEFELDGRYSVDFRFRLDVSQLPRPFQIGALGQADWNIAVERSQRLTAENAR